MMINRIEELREATGFTDDAQIEALSPWQRVRYLAQWHLGDRMYADEFRSWCQSQGLVIVPQGKE